MDNAVGALIARPSVASVITGATQPAQIQSNAAAATWEPSAADLQALEVLLKPAVTGTAQ